MLCNVVVRGYFLHSFKEIGLELQDLIDFYKVHLNLNKR